MASKDAGTRIRPWEVERRYKARSYGLKKFGVLKEWVESNIELIKASSPLKAQYVARKSSSTLSESLRAEGWTPLCGVNPTSEQIEETIRLHRLG